MNLEIMRLIAELTERAKRHLAGLRVYDEAEQWLSTVTAQDLERWYRL